MEFIDNVKSYTIAKAPDIMLGGGIVSLGFTIGLSVHAGMKIKEAKDEYDRNLLAVQVAEQLRESGQIDPETPYPPEDAEADRKDAAKAYAASVVKALGPAVGAGIVTAGLFGGAVGNANAKTAKAVAVAESAALTVNKLTKFIKDYRGRVIDEEGMLKDIHYALGIPEKEIDETVVDQKTGKKKKVKKEVLEVQSFDDVKDLELSPYQLIWGPYKRNGQPNHNFENNKNVDFMFLSSIESICESKLQRLGYMTLPLVFDELVENPNGDQLTLGWIKNFRDQNANARFGLNRDGHVNFRIKPIDCGGMTIFLLDFNCDGSIIDKIDDAAKQYALESGVTIR